jgi:transposase-like protein
MGKSIRHVARAQEHELGSLSELIHQHVRVAIEMSVHEELRAALGVTPRLDDDVARGLRAPVLALIDGNPGLRLAVSEVWPRAAVQRGCVHKLRNVERKSPKHALAEIRDDFHRIVLLFSLVASGQIRMRKIDGWRKIATVRSQQTSVAA